MALRTVEPSSEKMSHRRQRVNDTKYTPVRSACTVIAMKLAAWGEIGILRTISISNLTLLFIL